MDELAVDVRNLRKVYRIRSGSPIIAVDDVTFQVERGRVVGLLGSNGAGKTTTIKSILGLVQPTSGTVRIFGIDMRRERAKGLTRVSAVLEGSRNVYWRMTPRENLFFFAGLHGISPRRVRSYVNELLERFSLANKADAQTRTLSLGMKQKLSVACAMVTQTPVLFLDEPTLGLDVETTQEMRGLIRQMAEEDGRTVILSSHDMAVVERVCHDVIVMQKGRVVVQDRIERLLELFRAGAYVVRLAGRIGPSQLASVQQAFPQVQTTAGTDGTILTLELIDSGDLYAFIECLRTTQQPLLSIERRDVNLEEAYLRIVQGTSVHTEHGQEGR